MTELTTFHYHDAAVRMQQSDSGEPLFCLADVCGVLELANPTHTANALKEEFGSCRQLRPRSGSHFHH